VYYTEERNVNFMIGSRSCAVLAHPWRINGAAARVGFDRPERVRGRHF
jgi:hypothetical protein